MTDLQGRRAIVTGGASGIGRAAAELMAERGARVAVFDIDRAGGTELVDACVGLPGTLSFTAVDQTDADATADAVAEALDVLGGVDALVTSAGIMRGQLDDLTQLDEATWAEVLDVNLSGTFHVVRRVAPAMLEQGHGAIVLVSSKAGVSVGSGSYAYGASKAGVHGLGLTLDRHLAPRGIRVNILCPGDVDTPLYRRSVEDGVERGRDRAEADAALAALTPVRSIAEILAFLVSDAASAVRGTVYTS